MRNTPWVSVQRANGQIFYFNLDQVGMIFDNPADGEVLIYGNGWEKKFRPDEAKEFLETIRSQVDLKQGAS